MDDADFDNALITAFFQLVADAGWHRATVADAARQAELPLRLARARFPGRTAVLLRFGRLADQMALEASGPDGSVRDRLFDLLMRRFDMLQRHRPGVLALLHAAPRDPLLAALLGCATQRSMRWMLQAAGVPATGLRGEVQVRVLIGVWLWTVRAWERDSSEDLSATMAALDTALGRAESLANWFRGGRRDSLPAETSLPEPEPGDPPAE